MNPGILDHAAWVVFALTFANQAGVPVFAAPVLLGLGALARKGAVDIGDAAAVAAAGALCADLAWYGLGRWRGPWALSTLKRVSPRTGELVDDVQRLVGAHEGAFRFGARFLPELNPVSAVFAGVAGVDLKRFVVGAAASAAVWVGTWIGAGYLIVGFTWSDVGSSLPFVVVIMAVSAVASIAALIPAATSASAVISRSLRVGVEPWLGEKTSAPTALSEKGAPHADAALRPRRDHAVCRRVRTVGVEEAA